jgi:hypothetical protein
MPQNGRTYLVIATPIVAQKSVHNISVFLQIYSIRIIRPRLNYDSACMQEQPPVTIRPVPCPTPVELKNRMIASGSHILELFSINLETVYDFTIRAEVKTHPYYL